MYRKEEATDKTNRVLELYERLLSGEVIHKDVLAEEYGINQRSVQRDIDLLREFFAERASVGGSLSEVQYDRVAKGYRLVETNETALNNAELFSILKILLESRSLCKDEMQAIIRKLLHDCLSPKDRKIMQVLINNELWNYVEPRHGKKLVEQIWELGNCVNAHRVLELDYKKANGDVSHAFIKPVGIMCSEYYFYLIAYPNDADTKKPGYPTVYRIDRIQGYKITEETFLIPYKNRFEEGEFRKRIPFMYTGELQKVSFIYNGTDINAVLDRLPTAVAEKQADGSYRVTAEVYGDKGINLWLKGQNCTAISMI